MIHSAYKFSIFTKMWPTQSIERMAEYFKGLDLDGVELAVRPNFQLDPSNAAKGLPIIAKQFEEYGLKIYSVASTPEEAVFAGCAEAGISVIRVCLGVDAGVNYSIAEDKLKRHLDQVSVLCDKYNVTYGVQFHCDWFIQNSMQTMHLIESYDPRYIGAVWDAGHSGLAGEEPEMGLDMVWSHLCMVNLKNAFFKRVNGPEADEAKWEKYWTTGRNGQSSWRRIYKHIVKRNYQGVICLPAEYTDEVNIDRYLRDDIAFIKDIIQQTD